jgi:hypothetical protein
MTEFLELAELEEPANEQPGSELSQDAHTDVLVRRHLSWLENTASAISAIRIRYAQRVMSEHNEPLESIYGPGVKGPDFHRDFLTLRRLVTGFDHLSLLPAAWAKVRAVSDNQLCSSYSIGQTLEGYICSEGSCFGIEKQEIGEAYWEDEGMPSENYLPIPWAFAIYLLFMEICWRPDDTTSTYEPAIVSKYEFFRNAFGTERMLLMFGEDKPPYTAARLAAQEKFRRENPNDPDIIELYGKQT